MLALASAMLQRSVRGGLIAVGNLSLGGGVETVLNAAQLAEHAMEELARFFPRAGGAWTAGAALPTASVGAAHAAPATTDRRRT